jgi:glutamate:GABA antiporter
MNKNKKLSTLSLIMINIIAIDNLRSIPFSGKLGLSLLSYYGLAAILFFIPTALVATELATAWPNKGGIYVWIKEALGEFGGFMAIWLQWVYNVIWYPTILTFVAANIASIIDPSLATNHIYTWIVITSLFWLCTFANYLGLNLSSSISTIGATVGTLLPMGIILLLAGIWLIDGNPIAFDIGTNWSTTFAPDFSNNTHLSFLIMIIFGLIGIEMSAVHADEVNNPKKSYPKAILYSSIIIFITLILTALAVATVVKANDLSVTMGVAQAFNIFFTKYNIGYITPYMITLIVIGSISSVATWIIGPTKGLLVASQDNCLPKWFSKTNAKQVPTNILIFQAIIFTLLSFCYIFVPNVNGIYEVLSILTTQIAVLAYIMMFASAVILRKKSPKNADHFRIPGGVLGLKAITYIGTFTCVLIIIAGFIPPPDIQMAYSSYIALMIAGLVVFIAPAYVMYKLAKKSTQ